MRNEFVADGVADRLGQPIAMPRNHSLRPDRNSEKLQRLVRMKKHPDRQPRRAVSVQSGNHDYRQADQDFEGDWIDGGPLLRSY